MVPLQIVIGGLVLPNDIPAKSSFSFSFLCKHLSSLRGIAIGFPSIAPWIFRPIVEAEEGVGTAILGKYSPDTVRFDNRCGSRRSYIPESLLARSVEPRYCESTPINEACNIR